MWLLDKLGIPASINNSQTRVTSSNYSSINVPGPNGSVVVGTTAQDRKAMDVAIKAYKEGMRLETGSISPNGIPAYKVEIDGGSETITERTVQLNAVLTPVDAEQSVEWSIVSGTGATIDNNGLVTYMGAASTATVVVGASVAGTALSTQKTLTFVVSSIATPTFSPAAGSYFSQQSVTISCSTAGATIYYTTDGSTPTSSSSVYSSPVQVSGSTTIKAVAIKNGESSAVATAAYYITIAHTVTVSVTSSSSPVSGATVTLGGNPPESSSGGTYVFSVTDGTYTLSVTKTGYESHTETVTVNGSDVTVAVALTRQVVDLLEKAFFGNKNCMGYDHAPMYPVIVIAQGTDTGAYIQCFTQGTRCGICINRNDATTPITWSGYTNNPNNINATNFASLVEWPMGLSEIELKVTNSDYYFVYGMCSVDKSDIYLPASTWIQGGANVSYTLKRSDYPNAFYVAIWFKYQANSKWNNNTTIESAGVSLKEKL